MRRIPDYDPACETLAENFLQDEQRHDDAVGYKARVMDLAIAIQRAVEDWFADNPIDEPPGSWRYDHPRPASDGDKC